MSVKRSAFQVGVLVFLGFVFFIIGFVFFKREAILGQQKTVQFVFDDADGVLVGSEVEYSGVHIGQVDRIEIGANDGRAHVYSSLKKNIRIPKNADVWVSASVLGGRASIEILPNHAVRTDQYFADNEPIPGVSPVNIALLSRQATTLVDKAGDFFDHLQVTENKVNALLDQSSQTAASLNDVIKGPALKSTFASLAGAAGQAELLAGDMRKYMASDNELVTSSLDNVKGMTGNAKDLTQSSRKTILIALNNIDRVTGQLNVTVDSVNSILGATQKAWVKGNAADNISDTIENLKVASNKLVAIESDLRSITGDSSVQGDIKTSIHNIAEASGKTNVLIARLAGAGSHSSTFSQTQANLVFLDDLRTKNFRTDVNAYLAQGPKTFYQAGVRDLTGANHLNFEVGQRYNYRASIRAGVYNNKVAVGADYGLFGKNPFTLDLYDPNTPHLDLRQRIGLGDNAGLWFGMEDVFRSSDFVVGFDLRP